jgi:hypothetical protein
VPIVRFSFKKRNENGSIAGVIGYWVWFCFSYLMGHAKVGLPAGQWMMDQLMMQSIDKYRACDNHEK